MLISNSPLFSFHAHKYVPRHATRRYAKVRRVLNHRIYSFLVISVLVKVTTIPNGATWNISPQSLREILCGKDIELEILSHIGCAVAR